MELNRKRTNYVSVMYSANGFVALAYDHFKKVEIVIYLEFWLFINLYSFSL